jgi:hypothetical protein
MEVSVILILSEDQEKWKVDARAHDRGAVLVRPVTMKQLLRKLVEISPEDEAAQPEAEEGRS